MTMNTLTVRVEPLVRALLDGVRESIDATGRATGESASVERSRVDLGVVPVFSDERPLLGLAGLIDWRGSGCLTKLVRSGFCNSAVREQVLLPCDRRLPVDRLVLVGLGPREHYDEASARTLAEQAVRVALGLGAPTVLIALPSHGMDRTLTEVAFQSLLSTIQDHAREQARDPEPPDPVEGEGEGEREASEREASEGDPEPVEPAPGSQERAKTNPGVRWWVAADEAVVPRLRRVLSGPPRATRGGAGLHT
jgi:hypothetical protein